MDRIQRSAYVFWRQSLKGSRRALTLAITLGLTVPAFGGPKDPATREQLAAHAQLANQANAPLVEWASRESQGARTWSQNSGHPSDLYLEPPKAQDMRITQEQIEIAQDTQKVLNELQPGRIGTFGESANPAVLVKGRMHQWNELALSGLENPDNINRLLDQTRAMNITDIRLGLDLAKVDPNRPETIEPFIHRYLIPMWERGMFPIVTLDWFANLEPMRKTNKDGSTMHQFSYLNNPKFIEHREKLADMASKKIFEAMDQFDRENTKRAPKEQVRKARVAFNLINETHTKGSFERNFWHEAQVSGASWSSPELQKLYIPGIINIGRASVRMRAAIEKNRNGRTVLFYANEAMTPGYYPTHEGYLRFAVLKMVMGDSTFADANYESLMREPLDQLKNRLDQKEAQLKASGGTLNELEGMIKLYVFGAWNDTPSKRESARQMLLSMLSRYQRDVTKLKTDYKVTMKHRTVFGGDYYAQSEFVSPKSVPVLAQEMAQNKGEKLKSALQMSTDENFLNALRDAAAKAEKKTGVQIWSDKYTSRDKINFAKLLTMEDSIMMDLLVGFRYANWGLRKDADLIPRQQRLGLDKSMKIFEESHDEFRADNFLNLLLKDNAKMLYQGLGVKTQTDLKNALAAAAADTRDGGPVLSISASETLRDILNKDSRRILMRLFGLQNERFIGFLPPHYPVQIRAGIREGLEPILRDYAKAAGVLHVSILESGTPYYPWAERVHTQMLLSAVMGARVNNLIFVSYHVGPWTHTVGWAPSPLASDLTTNSSVNESGIFKFTDLNARPQDIETMKKAPEVYYEELAHHRFEYELAAWPGKQAWFKTFADPVIASLEKSKARAEKVLVPEVGSKTEKSAAFDFAHKLPVQKRAAISCGKFRISSGL